MQFDAVVERSTINRDRPTYLPSNAPESANLAPLGDREPLTNLVEARRQSLWSVLFSSSIRVTKRSRTGEAFALM
jgi:hypothetical protein